MLPQLEAEDALIRAAIFRERFNKARATQIANLLRELEIKLAGQLAVRLERLSDLDKTRYVRGQYTTDRLRALLLSVQEFSKEWREIVENGIEDGGRELIAAEIDMQQKLFAVSGSLGTQISAAQVYVAAKSRPLQNKLLRELFVDVDRNTRRRVTEQLRLSFIAGETNQQAIRSLIGTKARGYKDGILDVSRRGAEGIVRTSFNHLSAQTAVESYKALGLNEAIWTSTLDSRVTEICINLDATVIDLTSARPRVPPAHFRCRSYLRPKLDGEEGLTRASNGSDGPKPIKNVAYPEFFARQSAAFQREVLGTTKYRLYKAGVPLGKFTDTKATRAYSIAQLRRNHAQIFEDLGI